MRGDVKHGLATVFFPIIDRLAGITWSAAPRPPHGAVVRGPGHDPHRVLLAGGSSAVGWGVTSHELGLAGHLARATSTITHRGTDIEVLADPRMSLRAVREYLTPERASRFDAIVLTPGTMEAYQLLSVARWAKELSGLLDHIASGRDVSPAVVLVGAEEFSPVPLSRFVGSRAVAHARVLNASSRSIVAGRQRVAYVDSGMSVPADRPSLLDGEQAPLYSTSALAIAPILAELLEHGPALLRRPVNEGERARAVRYLQGWQRLDGDPVIQLLDTLKNVLHVRSVDLFFVDEDAVTLLSATTPTGSKRPRADSLSTVTLEYPGGLVVADLAADPAHSSRPEVVGPPHLRFYAGVPVESPEGHPVAVLSIVDTKTRDFGPTEIAHLRRMAALVGDALFENYRP